MANPDWCNDSIKFMDLTGTAYIDTSSDFPCNITVLDNHASIHYLNGTQASASLRLYQHHCF
jgi:hypothetical protein